MKRIFIVALFASLITGLITTGIELYSSFPLIIDAEIYESQAAMSSHDEQHDNAWRPADGIERNFFNLISNIQAAFGFSLLLIVGFMHHHGRKWWHGLAWGFAGYTVFFLLPTAMYQPALPGTIQSDVLVRQLWWLATVEGSAFGLALLIFARTWLTRMLGIIILTAPHLIGTPPGEAIVFAPQALVDKFYITGLIVNLFFWLSIGVTTIAMYSWAERKWPPLYTTGDTSSANPVEPKSRYTSLSAAYYALGGITILTFFLSLFMVNQQLRFSIDTVSRMNSNSQLVATINKTVATLTDLAGTPYNSQEFSNSAAKAQQHLTSLLDEIDLSIDKKTAGEETDIQTLSILIESFIKNRNQNDTDAHETQQQLQQILTTLTAFRTSLLDNSTSIGHQTLNESKQITIIEYSLLLLLPLIVGGFALYGAQTSEKINNEVLAQTKSLRAALAKAKEADIAKDEFLAAMSHELRTPLNAVIGYAEMLIDDPDLPALEREKDLEIILASSKHLLLLINKVLDISKIASSEIKTMKENLSVYDLLNEVANIAEPLAQQRNNTLVRAYSDDVGQFAIDKTRLKQVLLNLLGNSAKFTENGKISLAAEYKTATYGKTLMISVADTGIGISQEELPNIFTTFYQVEKGSTRKYGGTGLGLSISKALCELMGIGIELQSKINEGTTITLTLKPESSLQAQDKQSNKPHTPDNVKIANLG